MRDSAKLCSDLTLLMPCGQKTLFDDLCTLLSLSVEGVVALLLLFEKYQSEHGAFCCTSSRPDFTLILTLTVDDFGLFRGSSTFKWINAVDLFLCYSMPIIIPFACFSGLYGELRGNICQPVRKLLHTHRVSTTFK